VRRHHLWLGLSGLTLFACLVLPLAGVLPRDSTTRYIFLWPPYLYGAALCVVAAAPLRVSSVVIQVLSFVYVIAAVVFTLVAPPIGVIGLTTSLTVTAIVGNGNSEARLALATVAIGALSTAWFVVVDAVPSLLYPQPTQLPLVASLGVLLSGLAWCFSLRGDAMPRAIVRA
jgi:hypothetical protein